MSANFQKITLCVFQQTWIFLHLLIHVKKRCVKTCLERIERIIYVFSNNTKMYLADRIQVFLERHKKYGFIFYLDLTLLSIVKTQDNSKFLWPSQKTWTSTLKV